MVYLAMKKDERPSPPSPEGMAKMGECMEESVSSGMVQATGQLGPTTIHLRLEGDEVSLSDGPFIESKEIVPGFTVIRVDSRQEAVDWATELRRCMSDGEIRIAQVMTPGFDDSRL
jgi:hypothetical protein